MALVVVPLDQVEVQLDQVVVPLDQVVALLGLGVALKVWRKSWLIHVRVKSLLTPVLDMLQAVVQQDLKVKHWQIYVKEILWGKQLALGVPQV